MYQGGCGFRKAQATQLEKKELNAKGRHPLAVSRPLTKESLRQTPFLSLQSWGSQTNFLKCQLYLQSCDRELPNSDHGVQGAMGKIPMLGHQKLAALAFSLQCGHGFVGHQGIACRELCEYSKENSGKCSLWYSEHSGRCGLLGTQSWPLNV